MKIPALLCAILAITVWWGPLSTFVQSMLLAFMALLCLMLDHATPPPRPGQGYLTGDRDLR